MEVIKRKGKVNVISNYIPKISTVAFDAEFDFTAHESAKITSYPLENGFTIINGVIDIPTSFKVTLAVGTSPVLGLLSDPVETFKKNSASLFSGFISNFIDSGLSNFALGLVSKNFIEPYTRGGDVYSEIQKIKITAKPFDLLFHNVGLIKNVLIESISVSRKAATGDLIKFDISLKQVPMISLVRATDESSTKKYLGEAKVSEET